MVKINMMAGLRDFGDDWVHVDATGMNNAKNTTDDITLGKQFDNSIDLIYCSHGIAYFDRGEMAHLLKQWFNKIRPGGKIEIATPNFLVLANMVLNGTPFNKVEGPLYGKIKFKGNSVYHKTCYCYIDLTTLLEGAGFTNVRLYDHRQTCHPNTGDRSDKYDDHSASYIDGVLISLNVSATKPMTKPEPPLSQKIKEGGMFS